MTQEQVTKKAQEIANECQFDGELITQILFEALTDANFHTLRKKLEEVAHNEFEEDSKL